MSGHNKKQLNPAIMNYIKSTTFKYYPSLPSEIECEKWNLCIISIDEASRRLKNKPKKLDHGQCTGYRITLICDLGMYVC